MPAVLLEWLRELPFQPFRIHLSDKTMIDVVAREFFVVGVACIDC